VLKNPFENKNQHISSKGPTPNTKRTIFAVLGVDFLSLVVSIILEVDFLLDFLLGILNQNLATMLASIINKRRNILENNLIVLSNHFNISK
tara:strand:+ start:292 stop:564 length:273 start_codon:yes stop_codon:yes gene_type:complete